MKRVHILLMGFHILVLGWFFVLFTTPRVPVLCFHRVSQKLELDNYLSITPDEFSIALREIRNLGCVPHIPGETWKVFQCQVLLSFDDSTEDHFSYVIPYLKENKWPSVFFVMGTSLQGMQAGPDFDYHWFGSHAYQDRSLLDKVYKNSAVLSEELDKAEYEMKRLGMKTLPWFALPRGEYSAEMVEALSSRFEQIFSVDMDYMNPKNSGLQGRYMFDRTQNLENMLFWIKKSMPQYRLDFLIPLFLLLIVDLILWIKLVVYRVSL